MSVAADIGTFKKTVGSILDRLGCPACCSGHDIHFELQRRFHFEGDLDVPRPSFEQRRIASTSAATTVNAALAPRLADNIEEVFLALDRIVDLSAHPACTSGDDLFLRMEQNILVDKAGNLDVQALVIG
jgi:hypothetical protein